MSGYQRCLSIRHLNTSSALFNATEAAVKTTFGNAATPLASAIRPRRRILSEDDRRRSAGLNRRTNAVNEKFREVQNERRLLIERHREAIVSGEQKDLNSIVEIIEFNQNCTRQQLQTIVEKVKKNPSFLKQLNDRQLSVLIQAGGKLAEGVSLPFRINYVEKLWKSAEEVKADLGVLSYNARIQANIENKVEQNAVEVLQEYSEAEIEADENTFALLAKTYALKGQTAGILQIIEILKDQNIPATQPLFESLVYSFAINNQDDRVKSIIQSLSHNPAINSDSLYITAAMAKAHLNKNVDEVLKVLIDLPISYNKKENNSKILELILVLIENGAVDIVKKLESYLYMDLKYGTLHYSNFIEREVLRLFKNGNETGALELFQVLHNDSKKRLRWNFAEILKENLSSAEKLSSLAETFRNGKVFTKPLARAVDFAYFEKLPIFHIYEKFIDSPEFEQFKDRPHLLYPMAINLCNKISKLKRSDPKRNQLFAELFDLNDKMQSQGAVWLKIKKLIQSEAEDEASLKELIQKNKSNSFLIASAIAENLLYRNKLDKLDAFMDGLFLKERIMIARFVPLFIQSLSRSNITEPEIKTIAKVIIAGFPENRNGSGPQDFCYRLIHDIFKNQVITDSTLTSLVQFLTTDPKVSLSKEEIRSIDTNLRDGNNTIRNNLLKQLIGKSKTMGRWLLSSIEDLNKEAEFLVTQEVVKPEVQASLYNILLQKLSEDKRAKNGPQILEVLKKFNDIKLEKQRFNSNLFVNLALKKCLVDKEFDAAKELWEMKKGINDDVKLMYSLCLLEKNEIDEAKEALKTIENFPGEQYVIRSVNEMGVSFTTVEKFIELIYQIFSPLPVVRKRFTNMLKRMELQKAIAEGDLEKAYEISESTTIQFKKAFGQNDLMTACISKGNKALLSKVFELVVKYHDRNTASIDLMVAFLECGNYHAAEQVFKKVGNLHLNSQKMEFIKSRLTELKRPEVIEKLMALFNESPATSKNFEAIH